MRTDLHDQPASSAPAGRGHPLAAPCAILLLASLLAPGCDMGVRPDSGGDRIPPTDVEPPLPVIASIIPDTALPGDTVALGGEHFGASADTGAVLFGDLDGAILSWTDTFVTAVVPSIDRSVPVAVRSGARTGKASPFSLTGDRTPLIVAVSPAAARAGDTITVAGLRFSDAPGRLLFHDGVEEMPPVDRWSDSVITAVVPVEALTGPLVVAAGSLSSEGFPFTVKPLIPLPRLTLLVPGRTIPGDTLTLEGDSLGEGADGRIVRFTSADRSAAAGAVVSWTRESVKVIVPAGAASGPVGIVDGSRRSNTLLFERAARKVRWADMDALFSRTCRFSGCHGPPPAANGLSTLTAADLLDDSSVNGPVIARRRSDESFLLAVLRASRSVPGPLTVVRPMPLDVPRLTAGQILLVSDWIDQGSRR